MQQDHAKALLRQGIAAAKEGRAADARDLLRESVRHNPKDEMAWLWLSSVAPNDRERVFCLKQVLALNPHHEFAQKGLAALGVDVQAAQPTAPATSVPLLSEEKLARLAPALDEVLRTYQLEPDAGGDQVWAHKPRRRYGEGAARRLSQAAALAALLAIAGLTAGGVLLADTLGVFDQAGPEAVVYRPVYTATPTATMTPTPGFGPTPTPFPARLSVGATRAPEGLDPGGSIYGLATPTAFFPPFDSSVERRIEPAVRLYSIGRYAEAQIDLATAQASYEGQCYPAVVYYHALTYAAQGGTANLSAAARVLEDGLAYSPPGERYRGEGYDSCPESPLLRAGLAEVRLRQGRTGQAYTLCQQVLEAEPGLAAASLIKAEIEAERSDLEAAARTIEQGLAHNPRDTALLVRLSDIALAQGHANAALDYAGRALYVDPLLLPALRAQTNAYLALARGVSGSSQAARLEYYGLAALSAQTLLLHYPGDAGGYLALAEARLGEGNLDLAEAALNRVLSVDDPAFREQNADVLRAAYAARAELYLRQGRVALAASDLRRSGQESSVAPPDVADKLLKLDLAEADFDDAALQLGSLLTGSTAADAQAYRLIEARLKVAACRYSELDDLACDDRRALDILDNEFIASLPPAQQAEAYSLRAQAQYWLNRQRDLPAAVAPALYQTVLDDLDQALQRQDTPAAHYFRGLVLAEIGRPGAALAELLWVRRWHAHYGYPFLPDNFDQQVAALEAQVIVTAPAAPPLATEPPAPLRDAGAAPRPAATATVVPFEQRPQLP